MVDIYIQDSGRLQVPYAIETPFVDFSVATQDQKRAGEYKVVAPLKLKVTGFAFNSDDNNQSASGNGDKRSITQKISTSPMEFTLTCFLDKPKNQFINLDSKDLPQLGETLKMRMSNGYKQLWIADTNVVAREQMFSLYQIIDTFGVDDDSLVAGTTVGSEKKHLKVVTGGITVNEGVENLNFQLPITVLWDFN